MISRHCQHEAIEWARKLSAGPDHHGPADLLDLLADIAEGKRS